MRFVFSCHPKNDLYGLVCSCGEKQSRYDTPVEAVENAPAAFSGIRMRQLRHSVRDLT